MTKGIGSYDVSYNKDFEREVKSWNRIRSVSVSGALLCAVLSVLTRQLFDNGTYIIFIIAAILCMLPPYYFLKSELKVQFEITAAFLDGRLIEIREEEMQHKNIRKLDFRYVDYRQEQKIASLIVKQKLDVDVFRKHISLSAKSIEIPRRGSGFF